MKFLPPFKTVLFSLIIVISSCKKKTINPIQIPAVEESTSIIIHVIDDNGGNPISGAEVTLYGGVPTAETGYQDGDLSDWFNETNPIATGVSDVNGEVVFDSIVIDPAKNSIEYYCDVQHKDSFRSNWWIRGDADMTDTQDVVRVEKNKDLDKYLVISYYPQNIFAKAGGRTWRVEKMHYPRANIDSTDACYLDNTYTFYKTGIYFQNEGANQCVGIENSYETYFIYNHVQPFGFRYDVNFGQSLDIVYMTKDSMRLKSTYSGIDNWIKFVRVD